MTIKCTVSVQHHCWLIYFHVKQIFLWEINSFGFVMVKLQWFEDGLKKIQITASYLGVLWKLFKLQQDLKNYDFNFQSGVI